MTDPPTRPYRKGKRAEAEVQTRRRITEAAVELHGTVGPANTTRTGVAKLAGVTRMTVYHHFPTDVDLFTACSTHWATENPFPDPSAWVLADPAERLLAGLSELYEWYALKQEMLGNVLRDVGIVPALGEVMDGLWENYMDNLVQVLSNGWLPADMQADTQADTQAETLHPMLRLAVDFNTWQVLTESGMDDQLAAEVMARMVTGAVSGCGDG